MTKNYDYEDSDVDNSKLEEDDEDLYSEEGREEAMEDDEVDELEEGFMKGYEGGEKMAKCTLCKKPLGKSFVEEEIHGEVCRFCSEEHADAYMRKVAEEE